MNALKANNFSFFFYAFAVFVTTIVYIPVFALTVTFLKVKLLDNDYLIIMDFLNGVHITYSVLMMSVIALIYTLQVGVWCLKIKLVDFLLKIGFIFEEWFLILVMFKILLYFVAVGLVYGSIFLF